MADYRYDSDERRPSERRSRSMFGGGWGPDPREAPDRGEGRGWFGEGRSGHDGARDTRDLYRDRNRDGGERGARRERDFGHDDRHEGLPIEETTRLIASNKVEGTPVYSRDGERVGTVYNFMVDKRSGQVEYAVMRYGGFLGMGQRYYPLPWRVLTYHRDTGGYVIGMSARDFEDAPSFDRDEEPEFDRNYGRRVHNWYGLDY